MVNHTIRSMVTFGSWVLFGNRLNAPDGDTASPLNGPLAGGLCTCSGSSEVLSGFW